MKIAISAFGATLDDELNPRLGRCEYFVIYDSVLGSVCSVENLGRFSTGAAGIATAKVLSDNEVEVVITGNVGPNAFTALEAAGIRVYIGALGKIKNVVQDYQDGKLTKASGPNVGPHSH